MWRESDTEMKKGVRRGGGRKFKRSALMGGEVGGGRPSPRMH